MIDPSEEYRDHKKALREAKKDEHDDMPDWWKEKYTGLYGPSKVSDDEEEINGWVWSWIRKYGKAPSWWLNYIQRKKELAEKYGKEVVQIENLPQSKPEIAEWRLEKMEAKATPDEPVKSIEERVDERMEKL